MQHPVLFLAPALHGAAGVYDELCTLVILILGGAVYLYLYFSGRRRQAEDKGEHDKQGSR